MRTYTIDQLDEPDIAAITTRLTEMDLQAGIEGIYWLPVAPQMLTEIQKKHQAECGPYCLALELDESAVHLELLVRGQGRLRCECLSFASPPLRDHMIAYIENMLSELGIRF